MNCALIVYIDILFLLNFLITGLILFVCSNITKEHVPVRRMSIMAAVSGVYSAVMFYPELSPLYSGIMKFAFTAMLVALTFGAYTYKRFIKMLAVFYLVSFSFGGAVFGVMYFSQASTALGYTIKNGEMYLNLSAGSLIFSIGIAYASIMIFSSVVRYKQRQNVADITLNLNGNAIRLKGLIDTGCSLSDPLSGRPVVVAEHAKLREYLPEEINTLFKEKRHDDIVEIFKVAEALSPQLAVCVIPFIAVGREYGAMPGIRCDKCEIQTGSGTAECPVVVGICGHTLGSESFDAILNPEICLGKKQYKPITEEQVHVC